jgi:hypothetical protein
MTDNTENPHPVPEGAGLTSRKEVIYPTQKAYQKTCQAARQTQVTPCQNAEKRQGKSGILGSNCDHHGWRYCHPGEHSQIT